MHILEYVLGTIGDISQSIWWHGTINRRNFQKRYFDLNFGPYTAKTSYQKIHITIFLEILHDDKTPPL